MAREKRKSDPIDGYTYEVTQLGALEGRKILVQVAKLVFPTIGAVLQSGLFSSKRVAGAAAPLSAAAEAPMAKVEAPSIADRDLSEIDFAGIASTFCGSADAAGIAAVMDALAATTEAWGPGFGTAGAPLARNFDEHFAGRYSAMLKWFAFALEVNYSDFFGGKGSVSKLIGGFLPQGSPSPASGSPST